MMSPSVFRRIPRRRSIHTRLHLPVLPTPLHGTNSSSGGAEGGRLSPTRSLAEPATPASTTGTGAVIGPLPTPPPDQGHSEEQPRDIIRIVSGNQYGTQHRTMLRHSFERLQERLRERQEALEQQERRLRGFLNVSSPTSSTSSVTSSASLDREEDPLSPLAFSSVTPQMSSSTEDSEYEPSLRSLNTSDNSASSSDNDYFSTSEEEEEEGEGRAWRSLELSEERMNTPPPRFPFTGNPGIKIDENPAELSPFEFFSLFIDKRIIDSVLVETNRFAEQTGQDDSLWRPVTEAELFVFFAMKMLGGIVKMPEEEMNWSHDELLERPIFRQLMTMKWQILQRMADRLNSLVNQEQEHQHLHQQRRLEQQAADTPETEQDPATSPMDNHMLNLRLLVRLALHLIYQLLNFICNQNVSYEERPISRLPNPFRDEETGGAGDGERGDLPPQMALDLEPGLHNLTTLLETVRMASEELRNDSVGDGTGESTPTQESARPNTNVPRHMSDFVRSSGNNGPGESTPTQESTRPNTFEPRRLSNFLRRSGNDGPGESTPTQESTRPNTNVPRHMSDFVRSQGNNGPRESAPTQENIREYSEISRHLASIVRNCGSDRTGRELPMQESRRHIRFEPRRLRDFFRSPRQVYEALSRVQESTRPNTFEPRRMSDFLRRPGNDGPGVSTLSQESTRPITNVPRRLSDFLRRSGNLSQHQDTNGGFGRAGCLGFRSSSPRPQLVIPRITLSDPSGSESQVEEESSLSGPTPGPSHNDQADFSTRSVSGVPLRLLGRQYAVDRRSPDSEDSPGPLDGVQDGPSHPPEPPFPWRGHLAPYDIGLPRGPGSEMLFRPNLQRAPPDRAAEREADNFFSRPHFTPHFGASRTISANSATNKQPNAHRNSNNQHSPLTTTTLTTNSNQTLLTKQQPASSLLTASLTTNNNSTPPLTTTALTTTNNNTHRNNNLTANNNNLTTNASHAPLTTTLTP
ncbi:PiggyBac transposable element-derived protein 4-like 14 [Homarus americanus]|uniref:PiggyBac transposable element-derived protein 4-like 14 n=1 Tax=Homarus americanus TaxID=6706 RepID=A0A8J5JN47_HOMAM|nr:PiggyBac transposable element-derived protein 4-like 14 [Homarus americanus]